jgi:transposase-like protein
MKITEQLRKRVVQSTKGQTSLREVARKSGVDVAVLSKWLRGERGVSGLTVDRLAKHFRMRLK